MSDEEYIRKCYELAVSAGKKGHESRKVNKQF